MQDEVPSISELLTKVIDFHLKQQSTKDGKNKKLLELLGIFQEGESLIQVHEKYLDYTLLEYWKEKYEDVFLNKYYESFQERIENSIDKEKLLELEIDELEIKNINNIIDDDVKADGERLGYEIAINGDNPRLFNLTHHMTKYNFGIDRSIYVTKPSELFDPNFWKLQHNEYVEIFQKIHWVCSGYTKAQKVKYLKTLKTEYLENINNSELKKPDNVNQLSNKQKVLLLHILGIFEHENISSLTEKNKGKLFGRLFGNSEKNTEDYIRYRNGKKSVPQKFKLNLPEVANGVNNLLKEIGLEKFIVTTDPTTADKD